MFLCVKHQYTFLSKHNSNSKQKFTTTQSQHIDVSLGNELNTLRKQSFVNKSSLFQYLLCTVSLTTIFCSRLAPTVLQTSDYKQQQIMIIYFHSLQFHAKFGIEFAEQCNIRFHPLSKHFQCYLLINLFS